MPLFCSPKLDGIRGCPRNGTVVSRTLTPLPSYQVQQEFGQYNNLDVEIIEGCETDFDVYNRTQSHVMSQNKIGDMSYRVFDWTEDHYANEPFYLRLARARQEVEDINNPLITLVEHTEIDSIDDLLAYEDVQLELGYEGIMMRNPVGIYKTNARCTFKQGIIFKLKRFADDEAVIVDIIEQETNNNPLLADARGYAKRSTNKENMVAAGTLGKFICLYKGDLIKVAPGCLSHKERQKLWDEWDTEKTCKGLTIKFRHFPKGQKELPRQPRCIGFRNQMDLI
jgi:ATP-dependent DNA ligase